MNNYIGLSFSCDNIYLAHFGRENDSLTLKTLETIDYPFTYRENSFFNDENIVRVSNSLISRFQALHIENPDVCISIESNLAQIKRVPVPQGLEGDERTEHIRWELSQLLISSLENYIYIVTDNIEVIEDTPHVIVICILKKVVDFFQKMASFCKFNIVNLGVNQLSAEICFQQVYGNNAAGLTCLVKPGNQSFECVYLKNGVYHTSIYEKVQPGNNSLKNDQDIAVKIKDSIKNIERFFEQRGEDEIKVGSVYIYGTRCNRDLLETVRKNLSVGVELFIPIDNINMDETIKGVLSEREELSRYVECIGIALDL